MKLKQKSSWITYKEMTKRVRSKTVKSWLTEDGPITKRISAKEDFELNLIRDEIGEVSEIDKKYLSQFWPGPYTFLIRYNEKLPVHLKNNTGKIALRVSNHLPTKQLFKTYNGYIVSTSANISGKNNLDDPNEIINFFECDEMAYYDEILGENITPSKIIDLESRTVIRE